MTNNAPKSKKRVLGREADSPEDNHESTRVTVRMSQLILDGIKSDMEDEGYSKKDRSRWISEAVQEMWEQFEHESVDDRILYLKLTSPLRENMKSFDIYLSETSVLPFYKMVKFAEEAGLDKDPKTRVAYMAISMRLIRRGRI